MDIGQNDSKANYEMNGEYLEKVTDEMKGKWCCCTK